MKLSFVILSDNGSLRAGSATPQNLDKLKASGFEQVHHSEDFLNALGNEENVFFLPAGEQDIESLYDETNISSLSYFKKENILAYYVKTL